MSANIQELIVLISPPASGKTYWISQLNESLESEKILVISPLRALADECRAKWGESIVVMTPEEWLGKKVFYDLVIFDEFHLFFYWGDSFRPLMWEVFFEVSLKTKMTFLLTATLSLEMKKEINHFQTQFDALYWIDYGNQRLKFKPRKYIKLSSRYEILQTIFSQKKKTDVKLIFCQFRNEVFDLEKKLLKKGYSCITCVGGESKFMAERLRDNPGPDFIIATTVLSHGVNLPMIAKIFFTYKIENLDFWIQMVARGGRKGEAFTVFSLEKPHDLKWNKFLNAIEILKLKVKSFFTFNVLLD
jgi:ATP-dependent DNA helicase RecQ